MKEGNLGWASLHYRKTSEDSQSFTQLSDVARMNYHATKQFFPQETWRESDTPIQKIDAGIWGGISEREAEMILMRNRLTRHLKEDVIRRESQEEINYEDDVAAVRQKACMKWCKIVWEAYRTLPPATIPDNADDVMRRLVDSVNPDMPMLEQDDIFGGVVKVLHQIKARREYDYSKNKPTT